MRTSIGNRFQRKSKTPTSKSANAGTRDLRKAKKSGRTKTKWKSSTYVKSNKRNGNKSVKLSKVKNFVKLDHSSKQIRERYINFLRSDIVQKPWSPEEDMVIMKGVKKNGRKWKVLEQELEGRSENQIKNRYYGTLIFIERRIERKIKKEKTGKRKWKILISMSVISILISIIIFPDLSTIQLMEIIYFSTFSKNYWFRFFIEWIILSLICF